MTNYVVGYVCEVCKDPVPIDGARVEDGKVFHNPNKKNCYDIYLRRKMKLEQSRRDAIRR